MKRFLPLVLFGLAFAERIWLDLGPNMELVTMAMVISAIYLGTKTSSWLVLTILVASDLVMGNSMILLFTWSGFLIPALVIEGVVGKNKLLDGTLAGLGATSFFFLWSNFGVWLMGGLYPLNSAGLVSSYINAIPFYKAQLVSTLMFVPTGILVVEMVKGWSVRKVFRGGELEGRIVR